MSYKIRLDIFEGPLDLLLYLIKKNDIDIKDIPIARITEQYMQYIDLMKMLDLDIVGDYFVMAATLMQIKSKMLLPPDPTEAAPVDPRDELVNRLQEYQQFKEIADILKSKEIEKQDLFPRFIDELKKKQWQEEAKEVSFDVTLFDLINALSEALKRSPEEVLHEIIKEEHTVEQKIHDILHSLLYRTPISLSELFTKARTKVEIIVTFLAVLELMRLKEIQIIQKKPFADIEIHRNQMNIAPVESKIE